MNKEKAFEFLGINKFRELGYTGSRIKIMSDEKIIEDEYETESWKKVICPVGYQESNSKWHGSSIMYILQDICPDATYIAFPMDMKGAGENYTSKCIDYILQNKVHLFTTSSIGGKCSKAKEKAMQDCIDNGTTFFSAAGNKGEEGLQEEAKSEKYLAIGAVLEQDGKLIKASYSSVGKELDYVSLQIYGNGTSYTTPTFCAMCGLVQDFFIDKTGRTLYRHELIKFINDNLMDVEADGFDVKTGNGLFILPSPATIDIAKYVPEYKEGNMFNQNNYANIPYPSQELPNATVKSGGCGLCCSANVLLHFGVDVDIKALAVYFCDSGIRVNGGTDMRKASEYIKKLTGCEVVTTNSEDELKKYIASGGIAIANVDGINDIFSTEGHFINVIGANGDVFTIFDVGYYKGKYDSEYRKKYVTVSEENGNVVQYCNSAVLNLDTKERNPNYYIFYRKEEEVNMPYEEEPSDWAKEAWEWACAEERNYLDGTKPKGTITREMLAQVLFNLFGKERK